MTSEIRVLVVSGNTFDESSFDGSTGRIWAETSRRATTVAVLGRSKGQRFQVLRRGSVTLFLVPRGPARMLTSLLTTWALPWALLRARPTVLVAQSPVYGGVPAVLLGRLVGVPVLVEIHGEHYLRPGSGPGRAHRFFFRPVAQFVLPRATAVRSLSPGMSDELTRVFGLEGEKIVEVPNRVDLDLFAPRHRQQEGRCRRIMMVGSLTTGKNQRGLLRDLVECGRPAHLVLAGDGPDRELLEDEARNSCVDLTLLGQVTHAELVDELGRSDAYVHYSLREAFPRAVLEAMAMGLPVVVTKTGFVDSAVRDGLTGLVLDDRGPQHLDSALSRLDDPSYRAALGAAARDHVEQHHEWGAVFDRYGALLAELSVSRGRI